jgi:hypothetical protein
MRVREANEEWRDRPFILFFPSPPPFLPRTLIKKGIEINKNTSRKNKNKKKQDKVL